MTGQLFGVGVGMGVRSGLRLGFMDVRNRAYTVYGICTDSLFVLRNSNCVEARVAIITLRVRGKGKAWRQGLR